MRGPGTPDLFTPGRLGPTELRNRSIKCGTNEGKARAGLVTDELTEWHRTFAAGGVGMSTLAYCSVSSEGRTFGDQIWMRPEAMPGLRRFADAMHAEGAKAATQLGHAGWFAHPRATGKRPIGPSFPFSPHAMAFARSMEKGDFGRMAGEFADVAKLAVDSGFDALEIHMGHG
jgi:2,4-dienoyl-CoA reductase-like NADH-dependent reductase (Old Yellow Enzyme family)